MIPLCIFHAQTPTQFCDDGFASAWIVNEHFKSAVEFHPGVYGQPPPEVEDRDVIVVDFSYPVAVMAEIMKRCKSMTFIDHHQSAYEVAGYLGAAYPHKAQVSFDISKCGALLTWDYYRPGQDVPPFLEYINDRDLFLHKLPGCREFSVALRSWPQEFINWSALMDALPLLVKDGMPILRYYDRQCAQMARDSFNMQIGGHIVPVANAPLIFASEVAGILCRGKAFAAAFCVQGSSRKIVFSLRSDKDGLNVAEIAEQYRGGGHKHAAGFTAPSGMIPWGDVQAPALERRGTSLTS